MAQQLQEYKCPCCGGAVHFDSGLQKMKCPYCETEFEMEALKAQDEAHLADAADEINWDQAGDNSWVQEDGMSVYSCQSCHGQIIGDSTLAATSCPYCGNPVVMTGNLSGELRPDLIIPFKLDKKAAINALTKHVTGKKLIPKVFKEQNHIEEIKGVYVPFWLFDADVDADIRYRATRVRTWSDSRYNYTETSYFSIYRSGQIGFQNIPVDGSSKMPDDLMESIEPFRWEDAVDFQTAYLAGYLADKYDVDANASIGRANERLKKSTEESFSSTVKGYATVTTESSSVRTRKGSHRYALLPIWLLCTKWQDKTFTFAMNGQTGKFVGDLPVDKGAYWRWFLLWIAVFSVLAYFVLKLWF